MAVEITEEFVWQSIPRRARDSHKGTFGSVLAVAGSAFYRGAALLAAEGALRTGAGIVTLASVEPVVGAAVTRLPECCLCPCKEGAQGGIAPENVPLLRRQKATVLLLLSVIPAAVNISSAAEQTTTSATASVAPGFYALVNQESGYVLNIPYPAQNSEASCLNVDSPSSQAAQTFQISSSGSNLSLIHI